MTRSNDLLLCVCVFYATVSQLAGEESNRLRPKEAAQRRASSAERSLSFLERRTSSRGSATLCDAPKQLGPAQEGPAQLRHSVPQKSRRRNGSRSQLESHCLDGGTRAALASLRRSPTARGHATWSARPRPPRKSVRAGVLRQQSIHSQRSSRVAPFNTKLTQQQNRTDRQ
jgi:hypothetical protein